MTYPPILRPACTLSTGLDITRNHDLPGSFSACQRRQMAATSYYRNDQPNQYQRLHHRLACHKIHIYVHAHAIREVFGLGILRPSLFLFSSSLVVCFKRPIVDLFANSQCQPFKQKPLTPRPRGRRPEGPRRRHTPLHRQQCRLGLADLSS